MSSRRFNSTDYLQRWRGQGIWPLIHYGMFTAAVLEFPRPGVHDGTVLDLCSSTGLLGAHLAEAGYPVVWADADPVAIALGIDFGAITGPRWRHRLVPETLPIFATWLVKHRVRSILARRCLRELADSGIHPATFGAALHAHGVQRLLVEGQKHGRNRHPLGTVEDQTEALSGHWQVAAAYGPDIRYLVRKPANIHHTPPSQG